MKKNANFSGMFLFILLPLLVAALVPGPVMAESLKTASETTPTPPPASGGFLLLIDPSDSHTRPMVANFRRIFHFTSIPFQELTVQDAPSLTREVMGRYRAIIITAETAPKSLFKEDILGYIESGGTLLFAFRGWAGDWMPKLGINLATDREKGSSGLGMGFSSKEPVFRNVSLQLPPKDFSANYMRVTFSPTWKVRLVYKDPPDLPLLLTRDYGKGSVVFWNSNCLQMKQFRGLFLFSLLRTLPLGAMSVFNATLFQIDDSPPPAYELREGPVYKDLGLTDIQFYRRVWYPKVGDELQEAGIKPTHFCCFTYSGTVNGPFEQLCDREDFFLEFIQIIKKRREEIALHGYNHQSLTLSVGPAKPWPSREAMVQSLLAAEKLWKKFRLPPTLLYVPPNNVIDKAGREAFHNGFTSIRGVCRLYIGDVERYMENAEDDGSGDEFGPDPNVPQMYNLPRISSGMFLNDLQKLVVTNGMMTHGIINHFVHPDDMFDPGRRGKSWEVTFLNLQQLLKFMLTTFPFGKKQFTGEFLPILKNYSEDHADVSWVNENKLRISSPNLGRKFYYVFTKTPGKPPTLSGAKIIAEVEPGLIYLVELTQPVAEIQN